MNIRAITIPIGLIAGAHLLSGASAEVATAAPLPRTSIQAPAPVQLSAGVWEILRLTHAKVGDGVVIAYITKSGTAYNLTPPEIIYLKEQGVSDPVLQAMLDQHGIQPVPPAPTSTQTVPVAQPATPEAAAPQTTYVSTPATAAPATYVVPSYTSSYSYPYPYYYYPYYGYAYSFAIGFGSYCGGYHGGYYHGGYYCGGGYHGGYYHTGGAGYHGGYHGGGGSHGGGFHH